MSTSTRFLNSLAAFDKANQEDPNSEQVDGVYMPKEYLYGLRMSERLKQFRPDASEILQLAARAQHIRRWDIPRSDYPMDRVGYKQWRSRLGIYHGEVAGEIIAAHGYEQEDIDRMQMLLSKRNLKRDSDVQTLEDVACLVFLEHYLEEFARKHEQSKLISILRKTWRKMSPEGQQAALTLPLSDSIKTLLEQALQTD